MKKARIVDGIAVDVCEDPTNIFHPDLAVQFIDAPDEVVPGWSFSDGQWSSPVIPEPVQAQVTYPVLSPIDFKMCFTSAERIGIKAMLDTDPVVADFYELVEDPRLTAVDINLQSVRDAVGYIFTQLSSAGVVAADAVETRIGQVISGLRL